MPLSMAEPILRRADKSHLSLFGYSQRKAPSNGPMPKAVVFGPREYGGIGLRHLYIEQG
jgi:hypothetical protein